MAIRSFWSDPYLWIHLAGIAAVPVLLEICYLGLAVGDPLLPAPLEWLLVAVIGIAPVLWMQWQRPFCIFSLLALALQPEHLTEQQRRILRLFKSQLNQILAIASPIFLLVVLWQIYQASSFAVDIAPPLPGARLAGLLLAAIAFLASNLFLQVPVSIVPVLLTSEVQFGKIEPYPVEQVDQDFTLLGWRVKQIVPDLILLPPQSVTSSPQSAPVAPIAPPVEDFWGNRAETPLPSNQPDVERFSEEEEPAIAPSIASVEPIDSSAMVETIEGLESLKPTDEEPTDEELPEGEALSEPEPIAAVDGLDVEEISSVSITVEVIETSITVDLNDSEGLETLISDAIEVSSEVVSEDHELFNEGALESASSVDNSLPVEIFEPPAEPFSD